MDKSTFLKTADEYIRNIGTGQKFKLKNIIGEDCPAYPGTWLYETVENGLFNNSIYIVEWVEKDYSDTYIKKSAK